MFSPSSRASPKFKNLHLKANQSPQEIKEKMRKTYKDKIQHCRGMLMDKFRGAVVEQDLCNTLSDIYKSMFDHTDVIENDEVEILEEIKNELVHEEMDWWLKEYEKSQLENVDWSLIEDSNEVICPICQKSNLIFNSGVSCTNCDIKINSNSNVAELKKKITASLEKHSNSCDHEPQFTVLSESNESHIYLICENCTEMIVII